MVPSSAESSKNYDLLLESAQHLCALFSSPTTPPSNLLAMFTADACCNEHATANPKIPFFGRDLLPQEYFQQLGRLVAFENMTFEGDDAFWVDERKGVVGAKGRATFIWVGDGDYEQAKKERSWDEIFTYRLEFADGVDEVEIAGGKKIKIRKVKRYDVWADTGAMERAARTR